MDPFRRRGSRFVAKMGLVERSVLVGVLSDVASMLEVESDGPESRPSDELFADPGRPTDPAIARLLPEISTLDDEVARDYRRFVHADMRNMKHGRLLEFTSRLENAKPGRRSTVSLELEEADVPSFLGAINDVRLVMAERLGVTTDEDSQELTASLGRLGRSDAKSSMTTVYIVLGWWQETLIEVIPMAPSGGSGLGSLSE